MSDKNTNFPGHQFMELLEYIVNLFRFTIRKFMDDLCLERATALAYKTLLSLIPCLAVIFVIYSAFSKEEMIAMLTKLLEQYLVPSSAETIITFLTHQIEVISSATKEISLIGLLFFIFTSLSLLNTIERVFNDIYRVKKSRSYSSKIQSFWAIISLGPLLLFLSISLSASLKSYWLIENLRHSSIFAWIMAHGPPFLLVWLAFLFLFQVAPNTRLPFKSAAVGALLSAVLWSFAKGLFGWYFSVIVPQNKFYGGLGSVPFFLLWVYVSWITVLFGLELSFAHQFYRAMAGEVSLSGFRALNYIQSLFLLVYLTIADDFSTNRNQATPKKLSRRLGIPESEIFYVVNQLKEHDLIHLVENTDDLLKPSRPLSQILVGDVIDSAKISNGKIECACEQCFESQIQMITEKIDKSVQESIGTLTIQQLLDDEDKKD